jgi:hypothetical protein
LDFGDVDEDVLAVSAADEAEPFFGVKELDSSGRALR